MTTTALALRADAPAVPAGALIPHNLDAVMRVGAVLAQSGYFKDARAESQAVAKVLYGMEIGIGPVSAMMSVHIIEGKPAPAANLVAARIKQSGRYNYRVREHSGERCRIEFFERAGAEWESLGMVEWSMEDARRAALLGRGPWKNYPRAMLFARAITEGARTHCPDVFGGAAVYTPEELGADVDAEGNPIGGSLPPAQTHAEHEFGGVELITDEQRELLENLLRSHVITDAEREKMTAAIPGMSKARATKAIDGLLDTVKERKEIEKQERADAGMAEPAEERGEAWEEDAA